ncbi:two component transcriptional regulator, LuxR family [Andreprevotia lacus DSM 23236]|jgi:DNA-binding NarL/FixJ family response regulator|uniref:Two component transcriptional regulator, LuxR family n=1 Tax=Andreprevotia lacus DSM 23236 TaxID=1121001 RepID=A0A1W1X766_9NEIS|nr:response regulator transcription factor [Andreprevotia lacus]SMC19647.1 two component transcriptional regulator, LuxR family [Andreprevotia lacus DSM 23236]
MIETNTLSVLIADDHSLVRIGVRALLEKLPRYQVIGEAGNAAESLALTAKLQPDILLLDIGMPDRSGLAVAGQLQQERPGLRIIVLSALETAEAVLGALHAGCRGYLVKDLLLNELELALDAVAHGDIYLSPRISHHLVATLQRDAAPVADAVSHAPAGDALLTERQVEVLQGIARSLTTKQIARELNISPKTVEFHRAQIIERLGVRDVVSLVRKAAKLGLVDLDE